LRGRVVFDLNLKTGGGRVRPADDDGVFVRAHGSFGGCHFVQHAASDAQLSRHRRVRIAEVDDFFDGLAVFERGERSRFRCSVHLSIGRVRIDVHRAGVEHERSVLRRRPHGDEICETLQRDAFAVFVENGVLLAEIASIIEFVANLTVAIRHFRMRVIRHHFSVEVRHVSGRPVGVIVNLSEDSLRAATRIASGGAVRQWSVLLKVSNRL